VPAIKEGAMSGENPVVHFEMPYEDEARLTLFYQRAFGWVMQSTGPQMGDYVAAQTAPTDENRMVTSPGTINGGFYPRDPESPHYPSVVIAVDDIGAAMRDVTDAGGTVLGEPVEIPGIGRYVSFTDTEGNRVSLLHPTRG
jgi:predicted enzyme related to lactoylglutathione lyase